MLIGLIKGSGKALGRKEVVFHQVLEGNLVGAEMRERT